MSQLAMGRNNKDISNANKTALIRFLHKNGISTRAEISKEMGLTQAAVSKISSTLLENNILLETGYVSGEKQRRAVGIALNMDCKKVIGVRISRRSYAIGLFNLAGEMEINLRQPFDADTPRAIVMNRIRVQIRELLQANSNVAAIGIAVPGPFDSVNSEIILTSSMGDGTDWKNVNLREAFGDEFNIPIIFEHDAAASALGNWWFGSYQIAQHGTLVHFLIGDGVGAGVIDNAEIRRSHTGVSMEIGHISVDYNGPQCSCGNYGCLERYCCVFAVLSYVKERLSEYPQSILVRKMPLTTQAIFDAAAQEDELALQTIRYLGKFIGYGVINLINAYTPDIIVISNEMAKAGPLLLEQVKRTVSSRVPKDILAYTNIVLEDEKLLTDPTLYGAGAVAINHCFEQPMELLVDSLDSQTI